jgi:membrane protein YdbS with pleckstrin-like domain
MLRCLSMKPNSKKRATSLIIWSFVWALALIASAFFFKGHPASNWIADGLFTVVFAALVLVGFLGNQRQACEEKAGG